MGCYNSGSVFKGILFPPGVNPIRTMFLVTVAICSFGNSLTITMPFSFLPRLMKEFGIKEVNVAYYVGITASSLYIGRVFGSYFWGWLCDRIGTRKSLLLTTAFIGSATLAFGFSKSVAMAVTTRLSQGLFGGVIVSLKAAVATTCDDTNRSIGFSFVLGAYAVGLLAGPALGGYLAFPAYKYSLISKGSLFGVFPVLLPNLIVSIFMAAIFVMIYVFIPGSPKREAVTEETKLVEYENSKVKDDENYKQKYGSVVVSVKPFKPAQGDSSILKIGDRTVKSCCCACLTKLNESTLWKLMRTRSVLLSVSLYGLTSFANTGFDELWPIFADSSRKFGGLNFTTDEIGTTILAAAIPTTVLMFLMARLERRFGTKKMLFVVTNLIVFVYPLFPYIGAVKSSHVWYALMPLLLLIRACICVTFFTSNTFLNDSAEPQDLGAVNGLGMTVSCIFRTISPILLGKIYSWLLKKEGSIGYPFNHFLPFVLCAFVVLLMIFLTFMIPKDKVKKTDTTEIKDVSV